MQVNQPEDQLIHMQVNQQEDQFSNLQIQVQGQLIQLKDMKKLLNEIQGFNIKELIQVQEEEHLSKDKGFKLLGIKDVDVNHTHCKATEQWRNVEQCANTAKSEKNADKDYKSVVGSSFLGHKEF